MFNKFGVVKGRENMGYINRSFNGLGGTFDLRKVNHRRLLKRIQKVE